MSFFYTLFHLVLLTSHRVGSESLFLQVSKSMKGRDLPKIMQLINVKLEFETGEPGSKVWTHNHLILDKSLQAKCVHFLELDGFPKPNSGRGSEAGIHVTFPRTVNCGVQSLSVPCAIPGVRERWRWGAQQGSPGISRTGGRGKPEQLPFPRK